VKALHRTVLLSLGLLLASPIASASVLDPLSTAERVQLDAGVAVVRSQDMPGSNWPAVSVYQIVNTTPETAMAIFTDYGAQVDYLRSCCGVLQSRVLDPAVGGDLRVQRVLYELEVPVVSNERYELREEMAKVEGGGYRVSWGKVSTGGHSESIFGRAVFEPLGGKTVFYYYNFTRMTAFGSGVFSGESVKRTQKTVSAMGRHMEQVSAEGGARQEDNVARVRAALGG
jgi:hypothetical protein